MWMNVRIMYIININKIMRKKGSLVKKLFFILLSALILTACGNSKNIEKTNSGDTHQELKPGEVWRVPEQWQLTINSVKSTEKRSQVKEDIVDVIIVNYTYQNLGYDTKSDLIFQSLPVEYGKDNKTAKHYHIDSSYDKPEFTPIGAVCETEVLYALDEKTDEVKIKLEKDGDGINDNYKHTAVFTCPVSK